jgi:hypothetical protein
MPFTFAGPALPVTLRLCRTLVWTQAAFTILGGAFILMIALMFGSSDAIPFHGEALTGTGAAMLGAVYLAAGVALAWFGTALGRLAPWARAAIVSMQVFLALLTIFRSTDLSVSLAVNVALVVAIVALLFVPDTQRALVGAPPA